MKSLSKENQKALKELLGEHTDVEKQLGEEIEELSKSAKKEKLKYYKMLTGLNTRNLKLDNQVADLETAIQY